MKGGCKFCWSIYLQRQIIFKKSVLPVILEEDPNQTLLSLKSVPSTTWPAVGTEESYNTGADIILTDSPALLLAISFVM